MHSRFALLLMLVAAMGCSNGSPVPSRTAGMDTDSNSIVVKPKTDESGAATAAWEPTPITVDTTPEIVCREFIEALQHGQTTFAEKLMSQESITNTRKHSLDLATPAGPGATYTIDSPTYATSQQKIAFVSVNVHDNADASTQSQPFTLMLKKSGYGWKISGIMLGSESDTQDLYSFENSLDVERIKSMVEGDQRQASADNSQAAIR